MYVFVWMWVWPCMDMLRTHTTSEHLKQLKFLPWLDSEKIHMGTKSLNIFKE